MIKNWQEHSLYMDFSGLKVGHNQPSDIDLFWMGKNHLVIGEIKNECGEFKNGQVQLLTELVKGWRKDKAILLLITHDKYVQNGDKVVDVSKCFVKEYFYKDRWHKPKKPTTVKEFIDWA